MYTGIVQGLEKILDVRQGDGFSTLVNGNLKLTPFTLKTAK